MAERSSALQIPRALLAELDAQARLAYPEECCGVLVGHLRSSITGESREVSELRTTPNVAVGPRRRRYAIAPQALLAIYKDLAGRDELVIGYYHSHPDALAVPSDRDLASAVPEASYLIVALDERSVLERRSWCLRPDGSGFDEQPIARGTGHGLDIDR
jgi:proteasome lid subunit RPN8/RPN11